MLELHLDNLWVLISAILVMMMQAGFALLEAGSTRMKNAGHVAAKQLLTVSISLLVFWACGYALTFGEGKWIGTSGWFLHMPQEKGAILNEITFFFQFAFLAVSLAIVWGGFVERAKLSVYLVFGVLYCLLIYPIIGHWVWGEGGWLHELGKQDFAGSTVVHLQGAIAAFVATLLLKPRLGKFRSDGSVNPLWGHNQVYSVLGVIVIWIGWFGFNAGSTLTIGDGFFGYVALTTHIAAAAGVFGAIIASRMLVGTISFRAMLNGVLSALVAITAACAFVKPWAAALIGFIAGMLTMWSDWWIEKKGIDDPISAASVHGIAGIWGTLSTGLFAAPDLVAKVGIGYKGLLYGGGLTQLGIQALGIGVTIVYVGLMSLLILGILKRTMGLRVSREEEMKGLDVSEHGNYGYGEYFYNTVDRREIG